VFHYQPFQQRLLLLVPYPSAALSARDLVLLRLFLSSQHSGRDQTAAGTYDMLIQRLAAVNRYQARIYASNRGLLDALQAMREGVLIADCFGQVLFANRFAQGLLGFTADTGAASTLNDWLAVLRVRQPDLHTAALGRELLQMNRARQYDVQAADGAELILSGMRAGKRGTGDSLLVINLIDVTRIREAQRLHREAIDFLSHDMRSPVTSLLALIQQNAVTPSSDIGRLLEQIERYARKSLHFTEQFLQLARVESDAPIQTYLLNLEEVVQNAIDDCYHLSAARACVIQFTANDSECWVDANGELLERVLGNLLSNAIKYGPERGVVQVRLQSAVGHVAVTVTDQGKGVPESMQTRLFAPYQRHIERDPAMGAGLGLRFVYITIKRLRGDVIFENLSTGAKFGFILPKVDL
jgi:signal transduction histidine kinase